MGVSIAREKDPAGNRRIMETLTARLPEWFAQEKSNRHYAGQAEILEAWTEQATQYVTAGLRWSARDYNLSLTKQRGELDYVVEGSEETPTESGEAWTFMRSQDGKWVLSAIQQ